MNSAANQKVEITSYFVALVALACALPLSKFLMTIGELALLFIWLFDGTLFQVSYGRTDGPFGRRFVSNLSAKWKCITGNKVLLVFVSLYVMHIVGLIYTSDFQYAAKDLRIKLPILVVPLVMSSMKPLSKTQLHAVLQFFVAAVFAGTLFTFGKYLNHDFADPRELSVFIYPIRFALNIVLAFLFTVYLMVSRHRGMAVNISLAVLLAWFVFILTIMESLSGIVCLGVTSIILAVAFMVNPRWRWIAAAGSLAIVLTGGMCLYSTLSRMMTADKVDFSQLDSFTSRGNAYVHDTTEFFIEDGRYTGLYMCPQELEEAWGMRSPVPYWGQTANGNAVHNTAVRYLESKGLRKDYDGLMQLTDEDIRYIENGVANSNYVSGYGWKSRMLKLSVEFTVYLRNPQQYAGGGSVTQRIEFTKASLHIIRNNLLFGVGTGDIRQAFAEAYDEINSPLDKNYRYRAHNQYMAICVAFGIVGLIWFMTAILFPFVSLKENRNYLYSAFLLVMLLSMFPEDTIESQDGATMFAFFNALLLFAVEKVDDIRCKNLSL